MFLAQTEQLYWLVLLVPAAGLVYRAWRRRRADWDALGRAGFPLSQGLVPLGIVAALLLFALARPMGVDRPNARLVRGRDTVFVIDVSRSMAAEDAFPTRLAASVSIAKGLIATWASREHDRAAVVIFAGRSVVRCPLTENLGAVVDALDRLTPGCVVPGGTDLGSAMRAALAVFDDQRPTGGRSIVILSDGEDHANSWQTAFHDCERQQAAVHAIAVGDSVDGFVLPAGKAARGLPGDSTAHSETPQVVTRRRDDALRSLALGCRGSFIAVGTSLADPAWLAREVIDPAERPLLERRTRAERSELFAWLVAPALFLLAFQGIPVRLWRPRLLLAVVSVSSMIVSVPGAAQPDDPGLSAFRAHEYDKALAYYQAALRQHADRPVLSYNLAESLFQLGRYDEALGHYRTARQNARGLLAMKVEFAIGNSLVALGQYRDALAAYDSCLAGSAAGITADSLREDARINRAFAERLLEQAQAPREQSTPSPTRNSEAQSQSEQPRSTRDDTRPGPNSIATAKSAGDENPTQGTQEPPDHPNPSGRTSGGGQGGAGSSTTRQRPEDRLASALQTIESGKRNRLDELAPASAENIGPDW